MSSRNDIGFEIGIGTYAGCAPNRIKECQRQWKWSKGIVLRKIRTGSFTSYWHTTVLINWPRLPSVPVSQRELQLSILSQDFRTRGPGTLLKGGLHFLLAEAPGFGEILQHFDGCHLLGDERMVWVA
jgi:hypothetical protein